MKDFTFLKLVQVILGAVLATLGFLTCFLDSFFFFHKNIGLPLCLGKAYEFVEKYSINFFPLIQALIIMMIPIVIGLYFFISGMNKINNVE